MLTPNPPHIGVRARPTPSEKAAPPDDALNAGFYLRLGRFAYVSIDIVDWLFDGEPAQLRLRYEPPFGQPIDDTIPLPNGVESLAQVIKLVQRFVRAPYKYEEFVNEMCAALGIPSLFGDD